MKFECEKSMLASAIEGVSRAITNRAAIPVLEGIYMKAEGFNLTLTGYDMEMGITTTIECNVLVPGETVLDAKLLGSMVSRMPAGNVRIELNDEGQAKISSGSHGSPEVPAAGLLVQQRGILVIQFFQQLVGLCGGVVHFHLPLFPLSACIEFFNSLTRSGALV